MFIQTFDGPTWEELWRDILISVIPTLNSAIPEIISDANKDVNKIETFCFEGRSCTYPIGGGT